MKLDKEILIKKLQKDWKKYWYVELFKEKGFVRRHCKSCGKYFWTMNHDQDICDDSTCSEYTFLGNPPTKKKLSYTKTWDTIKNFFVKKKHALLERYPTVCRWYPLYFTVAGIVNFYRMVGDKLTFEFPANPSIMSQPCLRFNDIPNVGVSGRHYTCFHMIQQSSLWTGKEGYWKDECINLDFDLLTKSFGIKENEITFMEDAWIGYGAFGYSLEYFIRGLETGNAVFTAFEGDLRNYKVMKEKVIDMGAGLNRICWLTQGTPTSYDAVFGSLIDKMIKEAGIKYDKKFFMKYAKLSGRLNLDEDIDMKIERAKIAKKLDVSVNELQKKIDPLHFIYAIADHSRTLLYAINDGGIPSNVGGGYNLRVILRRSLNFLEKLDYPFELFWVVEEQSKLLKDMNPELSEKLDHIQNILELEKKRYKETKGRIKDVIQTLIERKTKFDDQRIIELYDSHGVTPEILEEVAEKNDLKIDIPSDFYSRVTERHLQKKTKETKKVTVVLDVEKTKKLYYDDEGKLDFKSKVLKVDKENVILDQTAFYPRSGGQEPDFGEIDGSKVYNVEIFDDVIVHKIEKHGLKIGQTVSGKIDSNRRKQIRMHHTATHLINSVVRDVLGDHVWQAGAKKDIDKAHLDITHYMNLSKLQLNKIERKVNDVIKKKIKIEKELVPRTEAEKKYGFSIYQGGIVPEKQLRIVKIGKLDAEACGGLHLDNTKDVEEILIFNTRKIQDGIVRLEYVAGKELVKEKLKEVEKIKEEEEEVKKRKLKEFREEKDKLKKIKKKKRVLLGIHYIDTEDMKELEVLGKESVKTNPMLYSVLIGNGVVFGVRGEKCKVDVEKIVKKISKIMGGSAGGFNNEYKGGGPLKEKSKEAYEKTSDI
jgi:alanyl-tRNA synthetase